MALHFARLMPSANGWRTAALLTVCLVLAAGCVEIFWLNPWSNDTVDQFKQATAGRFTDHHPPLMAALWRPFILAGEPNALIVCQITLYWFAILALVCLGPAISNWRAAVVIGIFLIPTSISLVGVIWKDVHVAIAWAAAWTLLFLNVWNVRWRTLRTIVALAFLLYGALVRHNAFIAAPPLLLLALVGRPWFSTFRKTASAYAIIALGILLSGQILNYRVLHASSPRTAQLSLPAFDMVAITAKTKSNPFPFELSAAQVHQLGTCYNSKSWDAIYYRESPCRWIVARLKNFEIRGGSVTAAWGRAILAHPVAYLDHRVHYTQQFFCIINCEVVVFRAHDGALPNVRIVHAYSAWMDLGRWLFPPFVALLAGMIGLLAALRKPSEGRGYVLAAVSAALLNLISYVPFGVASDQRYAYPSFLLLAFAAAGAVLTAPMPQVAKRTPPDLRAF